MLHPFAADRLWPKGFGCPAMCASSVEPFSVEKGSRSERVLIGLFHRPPSWRLCELCRRRPFVSGFDRLDSLAELLFQHGLADDPDHDREGPSLEVLAVTAHDDVDVGRPVGRLCEGVCVT